MAKNWPKALKKNYFSNYFIIFSSSLWKKKPKKLKLFHFFFSFFCYFCFSLSPLRNNFRTSVFWFRRDMPCRYLPAWWGTSPNGLAGPRGYLHKTLTKKTNFFDFFQPNSPLVVHITSAVYLLHMSSASFLKKNKEILGEKGNYNQTWAWGHWLCRWRNRILSSKY